MGCDSLQETDRLKKAKGSPDRSGSVAAPALMLRLVVVVIVGFLLSVEMHWWL